MKPISMITAFNQTPIFSIEEGDPFLNVSEFFADSIQGENHVGFPATFLRLKGCTLDCSYCDSKEVWRTGRPYGFTELFRMMEKADSHQRPLIAKFEEGQHLVITGGSPLLQQKPLILFLKEFLKRYRFLPYIEIENECTLFPGSELVDMVSCWNNSPKLMSCGMPQKAYYKPEILLQLSQLKNSWFKFVIKEELDWLEIEEYYLETGFIDRSQVVLMPEGINRGELRETRLKTLNLAIKHNVRFTDREHIVIWNKQTGV